jgi:DNA-binding CsgD family transcriptional regulator
MSSAQPAFERLPIQRSHLAVVPASSTAKTPNPTNRPGMGLILLDASLKPVYCNSEALRIFAYPNEPLRMRASSGEFSERIRSVVPKESPANGCPAVTLFVSGRRRYVCRSFVLEAWANGSSRPTMAITLEREGWILHDLVTRYQLTGRETEAVQHLSDGLTSKEIAQRMNVSPNTVKAFLRLVMAKMGVTTRGAVIGKLIYGAQFRT